MAVLKLPGKWQPGINLSLLPLLEGDQNQVLLSHKILRQLYLLAL